MLFKYIFKFYKNMEKWIQEFLIIAVLIILEIVDLINTTYNFDINSVKFLSVFLHFILILFLLFLFIQKIKRLIKENEYEIKLYQHRISINAILETVFSSLSLFKQLEAIFEIFFNISWLSFEKKGAVFLYNTDKDILEMIIGVNIPKQLMSRCKNIKVGECLCGKAAKLKEIVFSNGIEKYDKDHTITYDNMHPHGHYCVPIMIEEKLIGVLNLYVKKNHKIDINEKNFLILTTQVIANLIKFRKIEEENLNLKTKFKIQSQTDFLTDVSNKRYFTESCERIFNSPDTNKSFSILFLDIDFFKKVNDTYGHLIGDDILKSICTLTKQILRPEDIIGRIGGEEFGILLHTNKDNAIIIGERLRKLIEITPIKINNAEIYVTISVGIVTYTESYNNFQDMLSDVDIALYKAKNNGRNQIQFKDY